MTYEAVVCTINTRSHPNADRIQLGTAYGYQVVIELDIQDGDIGAFFPPDGQLSPEMCEANDLIGYKDPETGERKGGFFARNRRVRSQNFRGEKSEGYWTPLSSLEFTGIDTSKLTEGTKFSELEGVPICNKYFTPKTKEARGSQKPSKHHPYFYRHRDTGQFRYYIEGNTIPPNSIVHYTEKLHGTSGRFSYLAKASGPPKKWYHKLLGIEPRFDSKYEYLLGSRNMLLEEGYVGFYGDEQFRWDAIEPLIGNLHKGETIFFELVGYFDGGRTIMATQNVGDSLPYVKEQYGGSMVYKYGQPTGTVGLYCYHITMQNEDGKVIDLPWPQVKARCKELGINYVPEIEDLPPILLGKGIDPSTNNSHKLSLIGEVDRLSEGPSLLDHSHIREGVSIRVERGDGGVDFVKHKSFTFGVLEGYLKDRDDYVDPEEIS